MRMQLAHDRAPRADGGFFGVAAYSCYSNNQNALAAGRRHRRALPSRSRVARAPQTLALGSARRDRKLLSQPGPRGRRRLYVRQFLGQLVPPLASAETHRRLTAWPRRAVRFNGVNYLRNRIDQAPQTSIDELGNSLMTGIRPTDQARQNGRRLWACRELTSRTSSSTTNRHPWSCISAARSRNAR